MSKTKVKKSGHSGAFVRNRILPWFGLLFAILLGYFAVRFYFGFSSVGDRPVRFSVSPGSLAGSRGHLAKLMNEGLEEVKQVSFQLSSCAGSIEALQKVNQREIDLALIQGGLNLEEYDRVKTVAVLQVEPLHLLVRGKQLLEQVSGHIESLKGKRVNLSRKGSGTRLFSTKLLSYASLRPGVNFEDTEFSYQELMELSDEELPDAVMTVSSQPSPVIQYLITQKDYYLVDLPYSDSLRLNGLFATDSSIELKQIVSASIPPFLYGLDPPHPPQSIQTLGVSMLMVAHEDVDVSGVRRICEYLYDQGFAQSIGEGLGYESLGRIKSSRLHQGVLDYLDAKQPASTEQMIEVTEQLVAIGGSSLGAMLFLWQWWRRRREQRRDLEFVKHMERVVDIENLTIQYESNEEMSVDDLLELQQELASIKTNLISQFKEGYLDGADLLSSFLKHANDTSELISRIVLHELEPKAANKETETKD